MLQSVIDKKRIISVVTAVLVILFLIAITNQNLRADNPQTRNMQELLSDLVAQDVTLYLEFIHPVAGQVAWYVPEEIVVDEQNAGQRVIKEVGEDYICIEEIGIGLQNEYCIPFSNLAFVNFYS